MNIPRPNEKSLKKRSRLLERWKKGNLTKLGLLQGGIRKHKNCIPRVKGAYDLTLIQKQSLQRSAMKSHRHYGQERLTSENRAKISFQITCSKNKEHKLQPTRNFVQVDHLIPHQGGGEKKFTLFAEGLCRSNLKQNSHSGSTPADIVSPSCLPPATMSARNANQTCNSGYFQEFPASVDGKSDSTSNSQDVLQSWVADELSAVISTSQDAPVSDSELSNLLAAQFED